MTSTFSAKAVDDTSESFVKIQRKVFRKNLVKKSSANVFLRVTNENIGLLC